MPVPVAAPNRLVSLDIYRGACALAVFLTHWFLWANFRPEGDIERLAHDLLTTFYTLFNQLTWDSGGQHPAVLGFFVLSGYCIHRSSARESDTRRKWTDYFRRRSLRILPVYWWSTLLGLVLVGLQTAWPSANPMIVIHTEGGVKELLLRVLALPAIVPADVILGNWTLNTVSSEIALYGLYPLLLWGTRRFGWLLPMACLLGLQFWALAIAPRFSPYWLVNTPLIMGAYWYIGMLAAEWQAWRKMIMPAWAALGTWCLFLALREAPNFEARYVVIQLVRALAFATLLLWLVGREEMQPRFGTSMFARFFKLSGRVSYSLYAVHTPVIMATSWALYMLPEWRSNLLQLVVTLLTSIAVTTLTYRYVEQPFLRRASVPSRSSLSET